MAGEPRRRRVGAYAKLLANYPSDDAIIEAGEKAELLFVRGLAFCASSDSDGYITDSQLVRVVGSGMTDAKKRAQTLVKVGVWQRVDGGYVVRSWLKIHESSEEKGYKRKTDRERKRAQNPQDVQPDSERNPSGASVDSLYCSVNSEGDHYTEQFSTDQSRAATPRDGAHPRPIYIDHRPSLSDYPKPEPFEFCSKHMPLGTDENCGPCGQHRKAHAEWSKASEAWLTKKLGEWIDAAKDCPDCDGTNWTDAGQKCQHPDVRIAA
jgi:hypothetical protein